MKCRTHNYYYYYYYYYTYMDKKALKYISFFSVSAFSYSLLSLLLLDYFNLLDEKFGSQFENKAQEFFLALIFAPIFETLLFQIFPFYFIKTIAKNSKYFLIIYLSVSGFLFASVHYYSFVRFIQMLMPGVLMAYVFYFFHIKKYEYKIIYTILVHSLHNLFIYILNFLL